MSNKWESNKPELNFGENDLSLMYKDHKDFFVKMHELRALFVEKIAESTFEVQALKDAYITFNALVDWTSSYIDKSSIKLDKNKKNTEFMDEKLEEIEKLIVNGKRKPAKVELRLYFRKLNDCFESSELLPKINQQQEDENQKFWKDEEHKAMKEVKKAFYDIMVVD